MLLLGGVAFILAVISLFAAAEMTARTLDSAWYQVWAGLFTVLFLVFSMSALIFVSVD